MGRVREEAIRAGPVGPAGNGEEGAEGELVVEDGVDVAGEELGGGEAAAVEGLGLGGCEVDDGDLRGDPDTVRENGVDKDGRGTEL